MRPRHIATTISSDFEMFDGFRTDKRRGGKQGMLRGLEVCGCVWLCCQARKVDGNIARLSCDWLRCQDVMWVTLFFPSSQFSPGSCEMPSGPGRPGTPLGPLGPLIPLIFLIESAICRSVGGWMESEDVSFVEFRERRRRDSRARGERERESGRGRGTGTGTGRGTGRGTGTGTGRERAYP